MKSIDFSGRGQKSRGEMMKRGIEYFIQNGRQYLDLSKSLFMCVFFMKFWTRESNFECSKNARHAGHSVGGAGVIVILGFFILICVYLLNNALFIAILLQFYCTLFVRFFVGCTRKKHAVFEWQHRSIVWGLSDGCSNKGRNDSETCDSENKNALREEGIFMAENREFFGFPDSHDYQLDRQPVWSRISSASSMSRFMFSFKLS